MSFVHLHNHTEFSLLDGAQRIPEMVSRAKEFGMSALAISDHGAMFGVVHFYLECKRQGIKPIIGMEAYVAPEGRKKTSGQIENSTYHLLLLAKNDIGYKNLCKLATVAAFEGLYRDKPRIDHETLREHAEGLISSTTCLSSEVCRALLRGEYENAKNIAAMYREIFGQENYYVELQDHGIEDQHRVNEGLLKIAKELNLRLICTNDSHYLSREDASAHDVLLCIQTNTRVSDENRMKFDTQEFYLKSPKEMQELFSNTPEAIENTLGIAERCEVNLVAERAELPDPKLPKGMTSEEYLEKITHEALENLYKTQEQKDKAKERLDFELSVIKKTGFSKYMLLVREFAQFATEKGIFYGARGSAAGSLVSYLTGITDVDPLHYNLTFERFLNPERVQMPDIDMDFEDERRDEIIQYVRERFGEDHVAQIITFGTMGAKGSIRDAGRAIGVPIAEVDRICKMVPNSPVGITIKDALKQNRELKELYENDDKAKNLIDTAQKIEGISRHDGVHAAGIVISKESLFDRIPLKLSRDGLVLTQYPMDVLEMMGLLKMDILGLINLTVLSKTIENIKNNKGIEINIHEIPLDDKKTFQMISRGETVGVFQLEGDGMRSYVMQLKPDSVEELTAMVALFRPGPMDHISTYIAHKFGRKKPQYLDERMEPILRETYGVITYQDQVLQLVRALAGFTLGKADILRRAMGKKDKKLLASIKVEFMMGCVQNGLTGETAEKIWVLLEPFAGYAFNKAHAVCYALIAYRTAYLKTHYPVEFMTAILGAYRTKEERVVGFIQECRRMGIELLQPDINKSDVGFTIENDKIRFGLGAIKGIGEATLQTILSARKDGEFNHLYDFTLRMKSYGGINRTGLIALIQSGALDCIDKNRLKLLNVVDASLAWAERMSKQNMLGQSALFAEEDISNTNSLYPIIPEVEPPTRNQVLSMERETLGVNLTDHPLRGHEKLLEQSSTHSLKSACEQPDGTDVTIAGVLVNTRQIKTKSKGELMATIVIEDLSSQVSVTVFPALYAEQTQNLKKGAILKIKGQVRHRDPMGGRGAQVEILAKHITPLLKETEEENPLTNGFVNIKVLQATPEQLQQAKKLIQQHPGEYSVSIEVCQPKPSNGSIHFEPIKKYKLNSTVSDGEWVCELRRIFSKGFVQIKRKKNNPQAT